MIEKSKMEQNKNNPIYFRDYCPNCTCASHLVLRIWESLASALLAWTLIHSNFWTLFYYCIWIHLDPFHVLVIRMEISYFQFTLSFSICHVNSIPLLYNDQAMYTSMAISYRTAESPGSDRKHAYCLTMLFKKLLCDWDWDVDLTTA